MKKAEKKKCATAAEQVFRTCELMPSNPVAKSESRNDRNVSGAKDTECRSSRIRLRRMGIESEWLGTQDLEENIELRHSAFSRAVGYSDV